MQGGGHTAPRLFVMQEHAELQAAYYAGIRLFNRQEYWHAHEQWEACWLASNEPDATFFKAIIQTAAALVKWQQGNRRGLRLNWAKSRARLLTLPPMLHDLDLVELRVHMDRFVAEPNRPPPILHLLNNIPLSDSA
jgi:uncharacterized protein